MRQIAHSIREFGFLTPILVDQKGTIICGYGRVLAARQLGLEKLPALAVDQRIYEWVTRPESDRAQANRTALTRIRESFADSDRTYGSPRVWRDLRDWGVSCSENRTARLMRKAGLIARPKRRRPPFDLGERGAVCDQSARLAI